MAQGTQKGSPGFFSVLLGVPVKSETPAGDDKHVATSAQRSSKATSYDKEPRVPPRSSLTRDRTRSDPSGESLTQRAEPSNRKPYVPIPGRTRSDPRLGKPSPRSSSDHHFVDAPEAPELKDTRKSSERHTRKVVFRTPTHSEKNGKGGYPRLEEAGSSSDSFFVPPPVPRSALKPAKSRSKHTRTSSKAEVEERNWNSSTATLQDKEELARSRSSKSRHSKSSSKSSNYPLARDSRDEGYQAVRVSGPDRVIIVPTSTADGGPQPPNRKNAAPLSSVPRRPGPMPIVPLPASMNMRLSHDRRPSQDRRASQDRHSSKPRPVEAQRSRSQRDSRSETRPQPGPPPQASRSHSRPNMGPPRPSMNSRPVPPMPDLPKATLLSQNMARARAGNRNPISSYQAPPSGMRPGPGPMPHFHDRQPNPPMKAQRA